MAAAASPSDIIIIVPSGRDDMTRNEYLTIQFLQKLSAFLSLAGSLFIVWQVLFNDDNPRNPKISNIYHRIMLVLSFFDILSSAGLFAGNWAIPEDTAYEYIQDNIGNTATCDAQG
eukprot:CAMPEP_0196820486 /NCGR_PEP_ID=MMETSP1362-20130617/75515_1 /TAXON_ID=163516 /ORGANISM="Leptocylindrus danicus, Strain CCMP1856" /LENGTH=115 /DNA_ID=CAMNT_0042199391 /DNA_START=39 /DNA_END=382 /DNA_ORIENTATION=-